MQTVRGGRVCVNVNEERESYFKNYQGLRQGTLCLPFSLITHEVFGLLDCVSSFFQILD
jgi:hypothetical protein